jgi:hypothetical protein
MDALQQAKMKCLQDALRHTGFHGDFILSIDEKTGKVILSKKEKKNKKDNTISSRFDILDL